MDDRLIIYNTMETINVVCCLDDNFVMPSGIMLYSLCDNNKNTNLCVYVIYSELTDENIQKLQDTINVFGQRIVFLKINDSLLPKISFSKRQQKLPISTYYRLFMSSLLPKDIDKVLYLDGDIIVRKSVRSLFDVSLDDKGLAAVPDDNWGYNNIPVTYNALQYSPALGYFNAGVLLINLRYWRDYGMERKFVEFLNSHDKPLIHHDQDVLNKIFCMNKKELPLTYNFMPNFLAKPEYRLISWEYNEEIEKTATDPVVLHYTGLKPWFKDCDHPYKGEFLKYKEKTLWKDVPQTRSIVRELKQSVKFLITKLGLSNRFSPIEYAYSYSDLVDNNK